MRPPSHRGSTTTTMRDSSESSQCLPRLLMLLRQSFGSAPAAERQTRHFKLANCDDTAPVDLESGKPFPANSISTAKYSLLTFIPRALFEQFRRLANVYFLIITVLMMFGTYTPLFDSPLTPYTTLIPLSIVLAISLSKEGFEDLRRHKADRRTNTQMIRVLALERSGQIQTVECKHVQVGRILKVVEGDEIPADLLFLVSSQDDSTCSVETANIDGETNLKTKRAVSIGINGSAFRAAEELHGLRAQVECEASNPRIHSFTGTIHLQGRSVPVDQTNLLLRGSQLRHTEWVLGIVVFTGYHTKIMQNSRQAPSKLSKIEETTNRLLYLVLGTQIVLATVSFLAYLMWSHANEVKLPYLCYQHAKGNHFYSENCQYANITSDLGMFLTFFVLYNNFVPISLYVTVEMVNYSQAYMIDHDPAVREVLD